MTLTKNIGWVFFLSLALLGAFVGLGAANPEQLARWANVGLNFTTEHFGWLYLFATTGFLVFCIGIAMSDYGRIRLGAEGEAPRVIRGQVSHFPNLALCGNWETWPQTAVL